jgi:tol-pal system protein YbgF
MFTAMVEFLSFFGMPRVGLSGAARRGWVPGLAVALLVMTAVVPSSASAQSASNPEIQSLVDRIERLQREVQTLQHQVYRGGVPLTPGESPGSAAAGGPAAAGPVAGMQVRLDEIETQMRALTGRLEEVGHSVDQLNRRLDKLASDIDLRLKALEQRAAATPGQGATGQTQGPPAATPAPGQPGVLGTLTARDMEGGGAAPDAATGAPPGSDRTATPGPSAALVPEGSPDEQYKRATDLLFRADYAGAERALAAFIEAHPDHEFAGHAQYWLGETFYVRGDFKAAARAFAKGYKDYPRSQKGSDNLLKLGMSLAALKKTDSACATFERLGKDFPDASSAIKGRVAEERRKVGCR